jgi:hypothetical protein
MAQLKEISKNSKEVREATKCSRIPKKHLNDFFAELVEQRGAMGAALFVVDEDAILAEAFDWEESAKGKQFWSDLEKKMLEKSGIIAVVDDSFEQDKTDEAQSSLVAIHTQLRELINLLKIS